MIGSDSPGVFWQVAGYPISFASIPAFGVPTLYVTLERVKERFRRTPRTGGHEAGAASPDGGRPAPVR